MEIFVNGKKCVKIYYITEKNMFKLLCQSSIEHNSPYSAKKKNKEHNSPPTGPTPAHNH